MSKLRILVSCEFSQIVTIAFRERGHEAYSCDLLPAEGGYPEWHYQGDVFDIINNEFDLMIAHPPCTYLCASGSRWMVNNPERKRKRTKALEFFIKLYNSDIKKIAVENPVGVVSTKFRKPDQYIQPFEHGHPETKKTGLWLKNLPLLKPSNIVEPEYIICKGKKYSPTHYLSGYNKNRAKIRSLTYQGIADAMANQWSDL